MSKQKVIFITVGAVAIAGLVTFFLVGKKSDDGNLVPRFDLSGIFGGSRNEDLVPPENNKTGPVVLREGFELYVDENYGFSFQHPKDVNVTVFPEGDSGYMLLAQKPGARESFQIFISAFDEDPSTYAQGGVGPITPERIRQDLPNVAIENPLPVKIGEGKNVDALIYNSTHESLGKTREIWFIWPLLSQPHGNYLYQITTYADMDNFIGPILDTLKFNE